MQCEQPIQVFAEGGEQQVQIQSEGGEKQVDVKGEAIVVTPITDKDYNRFYNKPQINGVELVGNKTDEELDLQHIMDDITAQQIDNIIYA